MMDRSTSPSLSVAWRCDRLITRRFPIYQHTSPLLKALHYGRPFDRSKRHRSS
jgi:hypothetical protein